MKQPHKPTPQQMAQAETTASARFFAGVKEAEQAHQKQARKGHPIPQLTNDTTNWNQVE